MFRLLLKTGLVATGIILGTILVLYMLPSLRYRSIVLHHTASPGGSFESIRRFHIEKRGWSGLAYHFLITNGKGGPDGGVFESRMWKYRLYHFSTKNLPVNFTSIAIALVGNFDKAKPTAAQKRSLDKLLKKLIEDYNIDPANITGHGDVQQTRCPGKYLNINRVKESFSENGS